jgi:hypothetical protein
VRRSSPGLAFARRHEVADGCEVVHREGQGATAPAVLGGTDEPFLDGHLARYLPGLAGGDAFVVGGTVRGCGLGCGGDGAARLHPRRRARLPSSQLGKYDKPPNGWAPRSA